MKWTSSSLFKKLASSRRRWIRTISYTIALIVALAGAAISGYALAAKNQMIIEQNYQRALSQLNDYMANLDMSLNKGIYATSVPQMQGLSKHMLQEANGAKLALEQLPVGFEQLTATNKFLSQVGHFCNSLTEQAEKGEPITEEQQETMKKLSQYSKEISKKLNELELAITDGRIKFMETTKVLKQANTGVSYDADSFSNALQGVEDGLADYPTLLYDGPFSDALNQQKPYFLEGKEFVSSQAAREAANSMLDKLGLKLDLDKSGEMDGRIPCYTFANNHFTIYVTKTGGEILSFINSRSMTEATLTVEQAKDKGIEAIKKLGFANMELSYYDFNDGVVIMNFVDTQNGIVVYPDMVKIGIATDNGEVVLYDATGYIMNHRPRELTPVKITSDKAREGLSKFLTPIRQPRKVIIPTDGVSEVLCYEFLCEGENEQVLVYINCETGYEQQISILLTDETGTLAM